MTSSTPESAVQSVFKFYRERCREEALLTSHEYRQEYRQEYSGGSHTAYAMLLCKTIKSVRKFVRQKEAELRRVVSDARDRRQYTDTQLAKVCYLHGGYLELLNDTRGALESYEAALSFISKSANRDHTLHELFSTIKYSYERTKMQLSIDSSRLRLEASAPPRECIRQDVAHVEYGSISYSSFLNAFGFTCTPVVFTNAASHLLDIDFWCLPSLMKHIGSNTVTPKVYAEGSYEWANHEDTVSCTIGDIIRSSFPSDDVPGDSVAASSSATDSEKTAKCKGSETSKPYLVDWSIPQHCATVLDILPSPLLIPRYFSADLLQLCPEGVLYRDTWPSLFIGPKGSKSGLHVDSFGSNFWMLLITGRKKWTFYSPDDTALLHPTYPTSFQPVFPSDAVSSAVPSFEVVLNAGELLFVPAGAPHSVENLTPTIAISANYVDESNIESCLRNLELEGLVCPRSKELFDQLKFIHTNHSYDADKSMADSKAAFTWREFKARKLVPRNDSTTVFNQDSCNGDAKTVDSDSCDVGTKQPSCKRMRLL